MLTDPLPQGYDLHLWSNVPTTGRADRDAAAARVGNGTACRQYIVIHDAFLNADKTGSAQIAAYSVLLMHVTQGRCYSIGEMSAWLVETGFSTPREVPSAVGRSALVATKALARLCRFAAPQKAFHREVRRETLVAFTQVRSAGSQRPLR